MAEVKENINALFAPSSNDGLASDVLGVFESILRLHSISAQELFFKWESYCLKMGPEDTELDLNNARMFQKDVQDGLERGSHTKHYAKGSERKSAASATPRAVSNGDVFGMLDELTPNALPRRTGSAKRKGEFDSPMPRKVSKPDTNGVSKSSTKASKGPVDGLQGVPFSERPNPGQIVESLNGHLPLAEAPIAPYAEPRVRIVANTDIKKFSYKPMSMRLSDSSEVLDERIDEFTALVQKHHGLEDGAFGNAASQSPNEIVAVGRIASDTPEGKLNAASLVLETSRRLGAGLRVQLKIDALSSYQFFPGQVVALRGTNASGLYFNVTEVLSIPQLPVPVSPPSTIDGINERLGVSEDSNGLPINVLFASGPYTADENLDFEPFQELCKKAAEDMVDAMILTGPFLDVEHPLLASGDFDLPDVKGLDQDASIASLFRIWISAPLQKLCSSVPGITVVLVPSVRDSVSKHVSWPQEQIPRRELGLPKQVKMLPNPCFISLNETVVAISSQDVLYELSREQVSHGSSTDMLTRLPGYLIEQRHFFPLYPPMSREKLPNGAVKATGACLDIGYLKLGEWLTVKPDILVLPSFLTPSVKVVESVMVVNPGSLSKRKGAGTYSQLSLQPRIIAEEDRDAKNVPHKVYERARVDVVRI